MNDSVADAQVGDDDWCIPEPGHVVTHHTQLHKSTIRGSKVPWDVRQRFHDASRVPEPIIFCMAQDFVLQQKQPFSGEELIGQKMRSQIALRGGGLEIAHGPWKLPVGLGTQPFVALTHSRRCSLEISPRRLQAAGAMMSFPLTIRELLTPTNRAGRRLVVQPSIGASPRLSRVLCSSVEDSSCGRDEHGPEK